LGQRQYRTKEEKHATQTGAQKAAAGGNRPNAAKARVGKRRVEGDIRTTSNSQPRVGHVGGGGAKVHHSGLTEKKGDKKMKVPKKGWESEKDQATPRSKKGERLRSTNEEVLFIGEERN